MKDNQVRLGLKVEAEHQNTYQFVKKFVEQNKQMPPKKCFYRHIVLDHLKEDKKYYNKLNNCRL